MLRANKSRSNKGKTRSVAQRSSSSVSSSASRHAHTSLSSISSRASVGSSFNASASAASSFGARRATTSTARPASRSVSTLARKSLATSPHSSTSAHPTFTSSQSSPSTVSAVAASPAAVTASSRAYQSRPVRWVRRGVVSDRRPNMRKKAVRAVAGEMYFLTSPLSHAKPKGSLNDKFFRMRMQHYDQNRLDNPDLNIPEQMPYEIDRVPVWWPKFDVYCKKEQQEPLVFYRRMWLRYEEPSFIHVTRVQDKQRHNKFGRRTVLTAWQTWRGVTNFQPTRVKSTSKRDWLQLDPSLGMMTDEIWKKLRNNEIPKYELPEPPCYDNSLEAEYLERENKRFEDIIESTRSKVV